MRQQGSQPSAQADRLDLREEHRLLDRQFDELIRRAQTGDWCQCDEVWDAFTTSLERHMADEESRLFPPYARIGPEAARVVQQLREEHQELRQRLQSIGVNIQLHAVRAEELEDLIRNLRAHAETEGQCIYPWLDMQAEPGEAPAGGDEAIL